MGKLKILVLYDRVLVDDDEPGAVGEKSPVVRTLDKKEVEEEVAEALVRLVEMEPAERPFRTLVSPAMEQLLSSFNAAANDLRPIVAQIFNVPELAGAQSESQSPVAV